MIIAYLNDCIAAGADGFRFDAAKHIELPGDPSGSDFWPRVLSSLTNKEDIYVYGEVLQGGADNYAAYTPYMGLTASYYGNSLRSAVGFHSSTNVVAATGYDVPSGVNSSNLVTFVETHDTYANDSAESTAMTNWQLKMAWALTAARAQVTPLYFNRPNSAKLGNKGNDKWKDADVVAVNKFHNAMVGKGKYLRTQGSVPALEVSISPENSSFKTDTLNLKLGVDNIMK